MCSSVCTWHVSSAVIPLRSRSATALGIMAYSRESPLFFSSSSFLMISCSCAYFCCSCRWHSKSLACHLHVISRCIATARDSVLLNGLTDLSQSVPEILLHNSFYINWNKCVSLRMVVDYSICKSRFWARWHQCGNHTWSSASCSSADCCVPARMSSLLESCRFKSLT